MNSLFFFYTIAMLTLCIVTAVFSFAALASTRRRLFFFSTGAFVCYAIELTEIFFPTSTSLRTSRSPWTSTTPSRCPCFAPL